MMLNLYETNTEGHLYQLLEEDVLEEKAQAIVRGVVQRLHRMLNERRPIDTLELSSRAQNVLHRCDIRTAGDLSDWPKTLPRAGTKTFMELKQQLDELGLPCPKTILVHFKRKANAVR